MAIRLGLIGAGRAGRMHVDGLAAFPDVKIAAVCDTDRARAEAVALPFGASAHINFRTLLEAERLDAVVVCLPPNSRGEPECAAARAGIHLLVEPPVALTAEKARLIQKEVEKAGVVAVAAYPGRCYSGTEGARELLKERRIALVRAVHMAPPPEGWRRRREAAGGQFLLEATDLIDLARHLAGEMSTVAAVQFEGILAARLADYAIEDALTAVVRFRGGAVGEFVSSCLSPQSEHGLTILADGMQLVLTEKSLEVVESGRRTILEHTGSPIQAMHQSFLEAVKGGRPRPALASFADAVRSLEAALAAHEAAASGRVVSL